MQIDIELQSQGQVHRAALDENGWLGKTKANGVENGAQVTAMEGHRQKLFRERHLSLSSNTHSGKHCSYGRKPGWQFESVLYHPPTVWP